MTFTGRPVKWALALFAVVLVGILVAVKLWERQPEVVNQPKPDTAKSLPEMTLSGMEFTEIEQGQKRWTLKASEARYFQNAQKTELKKVHLVFFLTEGREIQLDGREGILYAGTKNIELLGGVQAIVPRGYRVTTEYLFYDHQLQKISSETAIAIDGPDLQLHGDRWEYVIPEQRAILENKVQATLRLDFLSEPVENLTR